MTIQTGTMKSTLSDAYKNAATNAALYSTAPGANAGTELTGGSPAYARKPLAWGASASGAVSASAVSFDVASGSTVAGAGVHNAATASGSPDTTYLDGAALTSQSFSSQGTYTLTVSYTQS